MGDLSLSKQRALALTPKFTASLSIPCSLFLIYEVFCDYKDQRSSPIKRILVGMSVIDILSSFSWFLSTWAVPEGDFAYSSGNRFSCSFQGFFLQLAVGAPLYNSSLALFYLLIIKYKWTDLMLEPVERWVHAFILCFSIGTSILLIPLKQYNHIGAVCWVIGDPQECDTSSFQPSDVPCERGKHSYLYGLFLFYGPLWVCVIACCSSMVAIYFEVQKTLLRLHRYSINGRVTHALGRSEAESKRVAVQAALYSITFLITWMPSTLWSIAHWFNWSSYWVDYAAAFCEPLQGLWNFCVFARTRKNTRAKVAWLFSKVCPCYKWDPDAYGSGSLHRGSTGHSKIRNSRISEANRSTPMSANSATDERAERRQGGNAESISSLPVESSPIVQGLGISASEFHELEDLDNVEEGNGTLTPLPEEQQNTLSSSVQQSDPSSETQSIDPDPQPGLPESEVAGCRQGQASRSERSELVQS